MRRILIAVAASLLLGACASPLPQTPPSGLAGTVSMAPPKAGSTWRFAVSDGFTRLARGHVDYRVVDVLSDSIRVEVAGYDGNRTETYTHGWNWLVRPATNMQTFVYEPAYQALPFPIEAGKTWRHAGTATDPATGKRFPVRIDGEVLGWERIRVPAGEFEAIKLRRIVYLDYFEQGVRGQSWIIETDWYAPAVAHVARQETTSKYWRLASGTPQYRFIRVGDNPSSDGDLLPRFEQDDWLVYELASYTR
jgi:hypothetical protein